MNRVVMQSAFLLHLRPYRETSALVELFSRDHGRIGAVARGVRGNRRDSRRRAMLQPFVPLSLSWSGRGELKSVHEIEAGSALGLNGQRLFAGLYINELTTRLLHRNDPHPSLFDRYRACLETLAESGEVEPPLRRYELRLMEELGYGLTLDCEADGRPVAGGIHYVWVPEQGLTAASGGPRPRGQPVFEGGDLLAIAAGRLEGSALAAAKRLCRQALRPLLGGQPLRSRELFVRKAE